jgi:hypothetical protein
MENGAMHAFPEHIPETATRFPPPRNQQNTRVPHLLLHPIFQDSKLYFKHSPSAIPQPDAIVPLRGTQ